MNIYITESDLKVGYSEGSVIVSKKSDGSRVMAYPIANVDSVSIFGKPTLSIAFLRKMLEGRVSVAFYTADAHYFGRLVNSEKTSAEKQRLQAIMGYDEKFCLQISKRLIKAKIANSLAVLKTFNPDLSLDEIAVFEKAEKSVETATSIESILGFEGSAAKHYFSCVDRLLPDEFKFKSRSTRPPLDPFNSMISLGYSMLYRNLLGSIEQHGMNAYFGVLHQDREGHAALASDLMEEWRAVIVDFAIIDLVLKGGVSPDDFRIKEKNGGCYAKPESIKKIVRSLSHRMLIAQDYLDYDSNKYSFQHALDLQLYRFYRALLNENPNYYQPVSCVAEVDLSDEEVKMLEETKNVSESFGDLDDFDEDDIFEKGENKKDEDFANLSNPFDRKNKILKKVRNTCQSALKGELHTTMIGCIGKLVHADFEEGEIRSFIDEFCALWGDSDFQRNGYYRAASDFKLSKGEHLHLQVPFVSQKPEIHKFKIEEVFESNQKTIVPLLVHRNVKYARGDKSEVVFSDLEKFEMNLRPVVRSLEEAKERKAKNLLKSITFGSFELNKRSNKSCLGRNIMLLDYDADLDGEPFRDERMHEIFEKAKSLTDNVVLLESVSSEEGRRKFHLLFLVRTLKTEEYADVFRMINAKMKELTNVESDQSCKDIARTMFVGKRFS